MKFKFNFHQLDSSQALIEYLQTEIEKAGSHLFEGSSCQVFCRKGRFDCQVQIEITSTWGHFRAQGKAPDFYLATDRATEKLSKQITKMKDKHQHHKKTERSKHNKLKRVNEALEFDNTPYFRGRDRNSA